MTTGLGPHERFLVVRAKDGWSVNLGADTLSVHTSRDEARAAAARHVAAALEQGRSAEWTDLNESYRPGGD